MVNKKTVSAFLAISIAIGNIAYAETDMRDVVRDERGNIVRNSWGNCVRTKWIKGEDACATGAYKRVAILEDQRTIYFDFNKSTITPAMQKRLDSLAESLNSDEQIKSTNIVGYADRIGSSSYNEALSKKRAETVRNYLIKRGFAKAQTTETRWFGEKVPATSCPDTLSRLELIECLQKDRRVEVEIDYTKEGHVQ